LDAQPAQVTVARMPRLAMIPFRKKNDEARNSKPD
jgi:hypothetical protein